ncbi:hypothetical protein RCL1_001222 [Eukaryota sp. TZLM3-RCL]
MFSGVSLLHVVYSSLKHSYEEELKIREVQSTIPHDDFSVCTAKIVCYHFVKYGNVSSSFKNVVLNALARFFCEFKPSLLLPKHQSLLELLRTSFPDLSPSFEIDLEEQNVIFVPTLFLTLRSLDRRVLDPALINFLNINDLSMVKSLTIQNFLNNEVFSKFEILPALESLTFEHSLSTDHVIFPRSLNRLKELTLRIFEDSLELLYVDLSGDSDHHIFDLTNLTNLVKLKIQCNGAHVIGFIELSKLKEIDLSFIMDIDAFHPNCRPNVLKLNAVSSAVTKALLVNSVCLGNTKFYFSSIFIPRSVKWNFYKNLVYFSQSDESCHHLAENILEVTNTRTLYLTSSLPSLEPSTSLECLGLFSPRIELRLPSYSAHFYISKLVLAKFQTEIVTSVLRCCPYLRSLELFLCQPYIKSAKNLPNAPSLTLSPYLTDLHLSHVSGFFLIFLVFHESKTFTLTMLMILPNIEIRNCVIADSLSEPNYSIQYFTLISCTFLSHDFLLSFERLQRLVILFPIFAIPVVHFLFPNRVLCITLHLQGDFHLLSQIFSTHVLNGTFVVTDLEADDTTIVRNYVSRFQSRYPNITVNLQIGTDFDLIRYTLDRTHVVPEYDCVRRLEAYGELD